MEGDNAPTRLSSNRDTRGTSRFALEGNGEGLMHSIVEASIEHDEAVGDSFFPSSSALLDDFEARLEAGGAELSDSNFFRKAKRFSRPLNAKSSIQRQVESTKNRYPVFPNGRLGVAGVRTNFSSEKLHKKGQIISEEEKDRLEEKKIDINDVKMLANDDTDSD